MNFKIYLDRIMHDKGKVIVLLFLLIEPCFEIVYYLCLILKVGAPALVPDYSSFLACNSAGISHVFQSIYLWFLPMYLSYLIIEDVLEEFRTGYSVILKSKLGVRKYLNMHIKRTFIAAFLLIVCSLIINLILVHIVFGGALTNPCEDIPESGFLRFSYDNPLVANLIYISILALCGGCITVTGLMISFVSKQRKFVYGSVMLIWLIGVLSEKSLVLSFQPFSEYGLDTILPIIIKFVGLNILLSLFLYGKEVWNERTCF